MTVPPVGTPVISVIVPVFNDSAGLRRCLEALERQSLPRDQFEVIVVDNGSNPPMGPVVAPFRFARCLVEATPGSYAARNAGVRQASGQLLAFTDADCQPIPDWLEQALGIFEREPGLSAIGGRIELIVSGERKLAELYELVLTPFPQQKFVEGEGFAATANMVVRHAAFNQVGPFNEALRSSGDRDWGNRLVTAGYQLRYAPQCVVAHPARRSVRSLVEKRRRIEGGAARLAMARDAVAPRRIMNRLHPPRASLARTLLLCPAEYGLGRIEGLQVLALAVGLVGVRIVEGARVRLGGDPVR